MLSPCIMCVHYIGECSVDRGEGAQYIRDIIIPVEGGVISTLGGYHDLCGGAN